MASKKDVEAGRAFVRLFLKNDFTKDLRRTLRTAGDSMKTFGRSMMAVGASITAPLGLAVNTFASMGDTLDKMAQRTGVAGSALAEFSFAAEQSGANLNVFEQSLRRMQRSIEDAGRGLSTAVDGLAMIGLTSNDLEGLKPDEQFQRIADGIRAINDPSKKAAAAMMLFGRSGTMLLPMLDGLRDLRKEARDLGIIPTEQEIKNAADLTDAINRVRRVVKKLAFDIGSNLAGTITQWLENSKSVSQSVSAWIKDNRELVVLVAKLAAGLTALGAVVYATGTALGVVATALKAVNAAMIFMAANPITAIFIGAAAAAAYLAFEVWKANKAQEAFNRAARDYADKQRGKHEADRALAEELSQLASKQTLTNDEMERAKTITASLESYYGSLGVTINEATKSIEGMSGAMSSMQDAQRRMQLSSAKQELAELGREEKKLFDAYRSKSSYLGSWSYWFESETEADIMNRIDDIGKRRLALEQSISAMSAGAVPGGGKSSAGGSGGQSAGASKGGTPDFMSWLSGAKDSAMSLGKGVATRMGENYATALEERKRRELELIDEVTVARIRADKEGSAERIALLEHEEEVALRTAQTDKERELIKQRYALERSAIEPDGGKGMPAQASLTATYSASAARISGYQASGPEQKMVNGIETIAKNTADFTRLQEEFLAGMRVA